MPKGPPFFFYWNYVTITKFTGTYGTFGACLRVNPWDYRQVSDAIHEALSMNEEEKYNRWQVRI